MGLRINQNIAAQNAYRNLSVTDGQMSKSLEKLSSGFRINRASDDAAGLSISEGLRSQTGGLKVAVRNAQDAISVVQTAEGALNETTSMLQRMRDLAVQANNASLDDSAKKAANAEFTQLAAEIDRVSDTTAFGKSKLLDGNFGMAASSTGTTIAGTPANPPNEPYPTSNSPVSSSGMTITSLGGKAVSINIADVTLTDSKGDTLAPQAAAAKVNDAIAAALRDSGNGDVTLEVSASVDKATGDLTFSASGTTGFEFTASDLGISGASTANSKAVAGNFQIGANSGETLAVGIRAVNSTTLGLNSLDLTKLATTTGGKSGATEAMEVLDTAIQQVSDDRAKLGASQNRFEHTINNLNVSVENLSASESRIRDTDMAQEMVQFTRNQILTQAGTSMLSQANQASQNVLSLLR
ncbi:flagellin N-terminal helical domain-containing protein [Actinoplanes derwentensis]|uniref:Flagellin n=2 Tax=Actinoplanes derwentensis TaxID=113562 RepID=A0A1H2CZR7_9ACTN|nr:flagellin [Actinoplanes derwentensis]GID86640.1 flagellin [Actinoplanes derwentensis]SDT75923.1 flagellin [Actinoplanes derwentensis]